MQDFSKLNSYLDKIVKDVTIGVQKSVEKGGQMVEQLAKSMAPEKTGHYKASISKKPTVKKGDRYEVAIGSNLTVNGYQLSLLLEAGTRTAGALSQAEEFQKMGIKHSEKTGGIVAIPHLIPALHTVSSKMPGILKGEIKLK